jgi:glycosyltransferase involved in cell wall biosynthesis
MKIFIVTDKVFPVNVDGGTAFTSYEWATFLKKEKFDVYLVYHSKKDISKIYFEFPIIQINSFLDYINLCKILKKNDKVFLNSAFKSFELLYSILYIIKGFSIFWQAHGSLDLSLLKPFKKKLYLLIWVPLMLWSCKRYICNSTGEKKSLAPIIQYKADVIENLFPIFSLEVEKQFILNNSQNMVIGEKKYFLIFGRINPKKKIIETIIKLYKIGFFKKYTLVVCGVCKKNEYLSQIDKTIRTLSIEKHVLIKNQYTSGVKKINLIQNAEAVLLFSDSEGLPIIILESVCLGTKVVCSSGCNADFLNKIIKISELSDLSIKELEDFITQNNYYDLTTLSKYDIGRKKLVEYIA